ncbi:MAG: patatin-like phospholipase family protein [Hyphomicrobiales bacterium]|nr:MAG: patatin-like phospholipase family protein [Hyphomicrobiales bacterium]
MVPSLGIALGSGGARGIAHVPYIEAIEELGLVPSRIAGTSMGALIGAGWASGMGGRELREYITGVTTLREIATRFWGRGKSSARSFGIQVQIDPLNVVTAYLPPSVPKTFEDLAVPFTAVSTDYFHGEQIAMSSGELAPAVAASMAIPGMFHPLRIGDRLFIDGGTVNPLPVDHVRGLADIVVAIDVNGHINEPPEGAGEPTFFDISFGATQIMSRALARHVIAQHPPDIFIEAPVSAFRALEFWRAPEILAAADAGKDEFKRQLAAAIEQFERRR